MKNLEKLKKIKLWVTIIGISLIPALYNLIFLSSMWDPYGRLDQLPVAVVNQDQSAKLNDQTLSIGTDMVTQMKEHKDLDFHFVSQKEAEDGLKSGDYYMIVTLPQDLSKKATTLLTEKPQKLDIVYQTSKGHSFVAAKMSDSAMKSLKESVSKTITETYTSSVFQSLQHLQSGMKDASAGSDKLFSGSRDLQSGHQQLRNGLSSLTQGAATLSDGAGRLEAGLTTYTNGVAKLAPGAAQLSKGVERYAEGTTQLTVGAQKISQNSEALLNGVHQLNRGITEMQPLVDGTTRLASSLTQLSQASDLSQEEREQIRQLIEGLPALQAAITQLTATISGVTEPVSSTDVTTLLTDIATQAQTILSAAEADKRTNLSAVQATSAYQGLSTEQQAEISSAISQNPSSLANQAQAILEDAERIKESLSVIDQVGSQLPLLQAGIRQIDDQAQIALPGATTALGKLIDGLDQVHTVVSEQISPASQQVATGVELLQEKMDQGTIQLENGLTAYSSAVDQLAAGGQTLVSNSGDLMAGGQKLSAGLHQLNENSATLVNGSQSLVDGTNQLTGGAGQLESGHQQLSDGLVSLVGGIETLGGSLQNASNQLSLVSVSEKNAEAVSAPVKVTKKDTDQVATNGVGLAPYMMSVSLMVVAISANVIFAKSLDGKNYSSRVIWAKSKLFFNGAIATAAAILLFGAIYLIGVEPVHPFATMVFTILIAWTLMALVTALIGWNNRYGSFIAMLLLLLQLGSSAGTYPIQLSPAFFERIQPFLPISYAVSGLRQTISMSGDIGGQFTALVLFFIFFCGLGLAIFRNEAE
ncbi:YhgE/Pip domain-containing protein [Streptococcus sp. S784/96/1]|uniref:YhgE/Pip domain-containing protein n=1 Tax=Streptococcus sp. S784/96/1 TaxID=2653499 RepID=UPI001389B2C7|nr:YhgE/Pip domain-containing protein [Streptococcus sp. S784/96/1]